MHWLLNAIRPAISCAAALGLAALIATAAPPDLAPTVSEVLLPAEKEAPPVWNSLARPLVFSQQTEQPDSLFRSSIAYRGLAAAALMRPKVVLATYEAPHRQGGGELVNVTLALEALDKLVIPPGAEFSFNDSVGPRLAERGYQEGLMFSKGKVVKGLGGGVCAASTAFYNVALEAGLPILERWMHSGPPSYAGPTRDSAVVFGSKDFRTKNDTPFPIWVRTAVDADVARVTLLSYRAPDYKVVLREEGPAFVACRLRVVPLGEDMEADEDGVVHPGRPGCDRKLVREFWKDGKLKERELICRDVRNPVDRVIAMASGTGSDMALEAPTAIDEPIVPPVAMPGKVTAADHGILPLAPLASPRPPQAHRPPATPLP